MDAHAVLVAVLCTSIVALLLLVRLSSQHLVAALENLYPGVNRRAAAQAVKGVRPAGRLEQFFEPAGVPLARRARQLTICGWFALATAAVSAILIASR